MSETSRLKRARYPMPAFVAQALEGRKLLAAYRERPPYQQNDYIGWITRAKQAATQQKRLQQMLDELERGDAYMKMTYRAKTANTNAHANPGTQDERE